MALTVKHSKTSTIPDAGDTSLVQPSDWNADHTLTGTVPVANGGTGATTANDGLNALLPTQTGNNGKVLSTDGTNTSWTAVGGTGTVTSVGTGTGLSGGPITGAGTINFSNANVATFAATPTSANLAAAVTDETGSGSLVFGTNPTLANPNIDVVDFDTSYATTLTAGQLGWDGNNTLAIGMAGGNVIQHIGEDSYFYYKATSAVTKGQVVMFTGAVGASGVPTGAPATGITDGTYIMGIAAESVALNGFGLVQCFGELRNVNTSGYADGDILWYDPSVTGGMTKTKPSAPNVKVQMAAVINGGSAGGGTILIRVNPGSTLGGTDSNAQITSPSNGQILTYDGTNAYWKNTSLTAGTGVSVSPSSTGVLTVTNTAPDQTVSLTAGSNVTITGTYPSFTIAATGGGSTSPAGANTQVQYNNSGAFGASSTFTYDGTTLKATNLETTGGVLADSAFGGTYVDGIVMDYDTVGGKGRISVGGADSLYFYNGGIAGSLLGSAASNGNWTFNGNVRAGTGSLVGGATNPLIEAAGSASNYVQVYVHNDNTGTSASSDFAAYPDNGTDASGWIDMGITSSTYSDVNYQITGPNEGYIFMSALSGSGKTGNLVYATDSTGTENAHQWYSGGFNAAKNSWEMKLNSTNLTLNVPLVSTVATGTAPFTVASTTQVANLNAATAGTATTATNATNIANTGAVATNASFYPALLGANTTSNQGSNTAAGLSFNPSTNLLSPSAVLLAASAGTVPPLQFTSGTNLGTAAAGALEYDGSSFYASKASATRGVLHTEQLVVLNTAYTLTSQTAAQKLFNATTNGAVTLQVGTYQFECFYALTGMSATSGSFGFAMVAGTAVIGSQGWWSMAQKGTATVATATAAQFTYSTAANTTLATASTNTVGYAFIKGIIKVTTAGTVIPSVSLGVASAAVVGVNSYFKIAPVTGVANANITVGNWS